MQRLSDMATQLLSDKNLAIFAILCFMGSVTLPAYNWLWAGLFAVDSMIFAVSNLIWLHNVQNDDRRRRAAIELMIAELGGSLSHGNAEEMRTAMQIRTVIDSATKSPQDLNLLPEMFKIVADNPSRENNPQAIDRIIRICSSLMLESDDRAILRFCARMIAHLYKTGIVTTAEMNRLWQEAEAEQS